MTAVKDRKYATIFQIKLTGTSEAQVLRFLRSNLSSFGKTGSSTSKFLIVTPNPEQLLLGLQDKNFADILNSATFAVPDGIGLLQANKFLTLAQKNKSVIKPLTLFFQGLAVGVATYVNREWLADGLRLIHGRKLMESIIRLANQQGWRIALLTGSDRVAAQAVANLQKNFKGAEFLGLSGPQLTPDAQPQTRQDQQVESEVVQAISAFRPQILFIGFGAPKQEKWAKKWLTTLNIGGIMVVGGAIDYLAGRVKAPPWWLEKLEMEWLWRLLTQKGRLRRILTAVVVFPWKVYLSSLDNN